MRNKLEHKKKKSPDDIEENHNISAEIVSGKIDGNYPQISSTSSTEHAMDPEHDTRMYLMICLKKVGMVKNFAVTLCGEEDLDLRLEGLRRWFHNRKKFK